jgi:hypothetical protein
VFAWLRGRRGGEQDRVVAEAVTAARLAQHEPAAEHGVLGRVKSIFRKSGHRFSAENARKQKL